MDFQLLEAELSWRSNKIYFDWKILSRPENGFARHILPRTCKVNPLLNNLGQHYNSTWNQNIFKPTAKRFSGNGNKNIEFFNKHIP